MRMKDMNEEKTESEKPYSVHGVKHSLEYYGFEFELEVETKVTKKIKPGRPIKGNVDNWRLAKAEKHGEISILNIEAVDGEPNVRITVPIGHLSVLLERLFDEEKEEIEMEKKAKHEEPELPDDEMPDLKF